MRSFFNAFLIFKVFVMKFQNNVSDTTNGWSKFQHWSGGRDARHTDYHIHILVALFWLLDRKTASRSLLSEEVRAKEL